MTDTRELERAVARAERAMDEAYSRYASAPARQRMEGVAAALRRVMDSVPGDLRRPCLELLADLFEPSAPRIENRRGAAENALLRAEVARLQQEQETIRAAASAGPIVDALLPPESECRLDGREPDSAAVAAVVGQLVRFAMDLTRGFLGTTDGRGAALTPTAFWEAIRADLAGESKDALARLLAEVKCNVGAELNAFKTAAQEGGHQLLREIDPLVLENELEMEGKKRLLDLQVFRFQRLWEAFQRKHNRLDQESDLYMEYFDGFLRSARHQLRQRCKQASNA